MAQTYNILMNRFNGTDHDTLLPKNSLNGTTDPTTSTKGIVGQFYLNTTTNPATVWQCVGINSGIYNWKEVVSSTTLITNRNPTINDDSSNGFFIGRHLINTITGEEWICVDNAIGEAVWKSFQYDKTISPTKVYGVAIDLTNSNPLTSVTYTDAAVGMTPGSAWNTMPIFKDIKPCMLKNGVVQYYLNPNDLTKKADGTSADITSGNDGDVMIEIPKTGFKISTSGNTLTIKITDNPTDTTNFKYYAHTRSSEGDRSKLYIGAYLGRKDGNSKLRSLSERTPTASQNIGAFRTQAKANGAGYDIVSFYPLTLLQCLFMIKYKNRDSQTALGRGFVDGNSAAVATGGTNAKGIDFGETTGKQQMCFLNIEDVWGNLRWFIDGFFSNASRNMLTAFTGFNDTGAGYADRGQGATADIGNYMSKPQGTTEAGFVAKEVSGSETTHFTDYASLSASRLPSFGGARADGDDAGVFSLLVRLAADFSATGCGARLMYL